MWYRECVAIKIKFLSERVEQLVKELHLDIVFGSAGPVAPEE